MNTVIKKIKLIGFSLGFFTLGYAQQVAQVSTYAGTGLFQISGTTLQDVSFGGVVNICKDANQNIYALEADGVIRKITPTGTVSTVFSGFGSYGYGKYQAIHVDNFGNIYLALQTQILKITGTNSYSLIAGDANEAGYVDNNISGQGSNAKFSIISGICSDFFGNLYVSESEDDYLIDIPSIGRIRKITPSSQVVSTFAVLNGPCFSLCFDNSGNIVTTEGNSVVKINPFTNVKTTIAGDKYDKGHANGSGLLARFKYISGLAVNSMNEIFVSEGLDYFRYILLYLNSGTSNFDNNYYIRKISTTNVVTDLCGGNRGFLDAIGSNAKFSGIQNLLIQNTGEILVADYRNSRIRKITMVNPPPAPTPVYIDAPANICLGSSVNQQPAITGGEMFLKVKKDSITPPNGLAAVARSQNFIFVADNNGSILKYNMNGTYVSTLNASLTGIKSMTADNYNQLYVVSQDQFNPSITQVHKINANGFENFSWGPTTSGLLNNVSAIAMSPNGILYVADTTSGYISTIDTLVANVINLPFPSNLQLGYEKPVSITFDVNNDMYLADIGSKKILKRNTQDNNYYPLFPGMENENLAIDGVSFDNTSGALYCSSTTQNKLYRLTSESQLDTTGTGAGFTNQFMIDLITLNGPKTVLILENTTYPSFIIGNVGSNKVHTLSVYTMRISPRLPDGLFFDEQSGTIKGTPQVVTPYTSYTITTYGPVDSTQITLSFSIDLASPISNTIGNKTSPIINTTDGLAVNFYADNVCEELAKITDYVDGNGTGLVKVSQTVGINLPTFTTSAGDTKFVRRSTTINSQNPDTANVRIELYFTHADIVHYNANNAPQTDFSNDTTAGTMTMSILQLHEKANGSKEAIKHNLTATWSTAKQVWAANFPVTKFSEFMATTQDALATFECQSTSAIDFAFGCADAEYAGQIYTQAGTYNLNYVNQYGCDSIIELTVFLDNDLSINMFGSDTLKAENTAAGSTYQWVNCDNNFAIIPGATSSMLVAADTGNYAVIITNAICTDTSVCAYIQFLGGTSGVDENGDVFSYSISPNPSNGVFQIQSNLTDLNIEVLNLLGQTILVEQFNNGTGLVNLSNFPKGIYLLKMQNAKGKIFLERLVKD